MDGWVQGLLLVLIAVVLEALVDLLMDRYKISRRGKDSHRGHH